MYPRAQVCGGAPPVNMLAVPVTVPVAVPIAPPTIAPTGPAALLPAAAPAASPDTTPDTGFEYDRTTGNRAREMSFTRDQDVFRRSIKIAPILFSEKRDREGIPA